jgi:branched-subunit amino acid ABC-type transport system permease component
MSHFLLGLTFRSNLFGPALMLGIASAGLYGILAVTLVLTYRVSRTIGFVQGGIAFLGTFLYYWLAYVDIADFGAKPRLSRPLAALVVMAVGGVLGALYGMTVTGKRMAAWPRIVLTTYSLAGLLTLAGITVTVIPAEERRVASPFGIKTFNMFGAVVSIHQVMTVLILVALVAVLTAVLRRTRTGTYVRAIADDVEASRFLGISLTRVGMGVYAFSGAIAGLAGVLLATSVGTGPPTILLIFLRALLVAVLGGFTSLSLALVGCLVLGAGETMLTAGVLGKISSGTIELTLISAIFVLVFAINQFRPIRVLEATGV